MRDAEDNAASRTEVRSELDELLGKLSGPLTPPRQSQDAAVSNRAHTPSNDAPQGVHGSTNASVGVAGSADIADPAPQARGNRSDEDELPAEIHHLRNTYQEALFPSDSAPAQPDSGGINQPVHASLRFRLPIRLIAASLVGAAVALVGFHFYPTSIDEQMVEIHANVDELNRRLEARTQEVQALQGLIRTLDQQQLEAGESLQQLRDNVVAIEHEANDQIDALTGKVEELATMTMLPEPVPTEVDATESDPTAPAPAAMTVAPDIVVTTPGIDVTSALNSPRDTAPVDKSPVQQHVASSQPRKRNWVVNLASHETRSGAVADAQTLAQSNVAATVSEISINEKQWYRVRVEGFSTAKQADAFRLRYTEQPAFRNAWIAREP